MPQKWPAAARRRPRRHRCRTSRRPTSTRRPAAARPPTSWPAARSSPSPSPPRPRTPSPPWQPRAMAMCGSLNQALLHPTPPRRPLVLVVTHRKSRAVRPLSWQGNAHRARDDARVQAHPWGPSPPMSGRHLSALAAVRRQPSWGARSSAGAAQVGSGPVGPSMPVHGEMVLKWYSCASHRAGRCTLMWLGGIGEAPCAGRDHSSELPPVATLVPRVIDH